jgi:hypothetical protein
MRRTPWLLITSLSTFAACGLSRTETVAQTADSLEAAQCDLGALEAAADACRTTYDTCRAVEGADVTACRQALHDCLPPPPERRQRGEHGDGGECLRDGDEGHRPPPPHDADGGRPEGGGRPGPRGEGGGRGPHPDPAAVQACRDALDACLTANSEDTTCRETERACVRAAFDAAFQAACEDATVRCANDTSAPCTRILARCAEGVGGGTCNAAVVE